VKYSLAKSGSGSFWAVASPAQTQKYKEEKDLQNLLNASEALSLWTDFQQIKTYFSCFLFSKLKPKRETPASRERMPAKMPGLASFHRFAGAELQWLLGPWLLVQCWLT
jgi:hypothetical protein